MNKLLLLSVFLGFIINSSSQNILVMDYNTGWTTDQGIGSTIFNYLNGSRPTVTRINTLPASFPLTHDQVWVFGDPGTNSAANLAPYLNYINAGGAVFFQSEVTCCNNQAAFVESLIQQLVIGGAAYTHNNTISGNFDYSSAPGTTCTPFTASGAALRPYNGVPAQNVLFPITNTCTQPLYNVGMAAGVMFASCDMISGNGALVSIGDYNMLGVAGSCTLGTRGGSGAAGLVTNTIDLIADIFPNLLNCQYATDTLDIGNDTVLPCNVNNFLIQSNVTDPSYTYTWSTGATGVSSITVNTPGTYYLDVLTSTGCPYTDTIVITTNNTANTTINHGMCAGNTYTFAGQTLSTAGTYYDTLTNPSGCDTIITLNLSVVTTTYDTINQAICFGDVYQFGSQNISTPGTYLDTLKSSAGCDSIVTTLNLTVINSTPVVLNPVICLGSSYSFGNQNLNQGGTYYDTIVSSLGCDSLTIQLNLTVAPLIEENINATICDGQTYAFGRQVLTMPGTYHDTVITTNGCDSATHLTLQVDPSYNLTIDTTICEGDSAYIINRFLSTAGIHTYQLTSSQGCDSIVNYDVTIKTDCHLYIFCANSFTPDQNGVNEFFGPVIDGEILEYEFMIFNRWGGLIFSTKDRDDRGWDGTHKGQKVKTDIYVWEIRYKSPLETGRKIKHGTVQVMY